MGGPWYENISRNKRLRPIRHKISKDGLHTSVDEKLIHVKLGLLTAILR
jgi:hypothetical protein